MALVAADPLGDVSLSEPRGFPRRHEHGDPIGVVTREDRLIAEVSRRVEMLGPVVAFVQVAVADDVAEESLSGEVERALTAVRASVGVVGWEIMRQGA